MPILFFKIDTIPLNTIFLCILEMENHFAVSRFLASSLFKALFIFLLIANQSTKMNVDYSGFIRFVSGVESSS